MVRRWTGRHLEREPGSGPAGEHICPACGRTEHVEKVSSVVHRNSGNVIVGGNSFPYVSTLAAMLSLPPRPKSPSLESLAKTILISWGIGCALALVIFLLGDQGWVDVPEEPLRLGMVATVGILGVGIPLLALVRFLYWHVQEQRLLPSWQAARERWLRLYYCNWDDVVFLRDSEEFEPSERASALISPPKARRAPAPEPIATPEPAAAV